LSDFKAEGAILIVIAIVFALHYVGTRLNKAKAKAWIVAHGPVLKSEFAVVGFNGIANPEDEAPEKLLKQKSLFEYAAYATGRQNVAFVDVTLTLKKRFNPIVTFGEAALSFIWDSMFTSPVDSVEATIYPFDGKEAQIVPGLPGGAELRSKDSKSSYDGFVWAIVNKDQMKKVRDDRYDVSITFTKDHAKLPIWLTVMSESAEITDSLLTNELASAVEKAGDLFESLIVSDQPIDRPTK
jgi:Kef-type K+ transport system membrane component KefB